MGPAGTGYLRGLFLGSKQNQATGGLAILTAMPGSLAFTIRPAGTLCEAIIASGFSNFEQLAIHVRSLQYGRIRSPGHPLGVLEERRGTCSSKHRLLAAVAHESGHLEVELTVGIYEMSEQNTPGVGATLASASLRSVPEAHCYLTVDGQRFDFTGLPSGPASPFDSLMSEHTVRPCDLVESKPRLHRAAIATWAMAAGIAEEIVWTTREACIAALAANNESQRRRRG
jgi:hypothetical protein